MAVIEYERSAEQQLKAATSLLPPSLPPPLPVDEASKLVVWEARLPPAGPACRVDETLRRLCHDRYPTLTSAKRALRRREVRVDGALANDPSTLLCGGQLLQLVQRQRASKMRWGPQQAATTAAGGEEEDGDGGGGGAASTILPSLRLHVLFEDDHMACVIKPPGIPSNTPSSRSCTRTSLTSGAGDGEASSLTKAAASSGGVVRPKPSAYQQMVHLLRPSSAVGALRRPRHVHRLDEPTGGLLLVAKTRQAQQELCAVFEQRRVTKRYRALVWGRLEGRGLVRYSLAGKQCETEYVAVQHTRVDLAGLGLGCLAADATAHVGGEAAPGAAAAEQGVFVTTVDLYPHTGRKHQLRRHMALLRHPMLGEKRYSFGYAVQRLESGQGMAPQDHLLLPVAGGAVDPAAASPAAVTGVQAPAAPLQAAGTLQAAAAAGTQKLGLLLCLWAVELQLLHHPCTGERLDTLRIAEPASYSKIRAALAGSISAAV